MTQQHVFICRMEILSGREYSLAEAIIELEAFARTYHRSIFEPE